MIYKNYERKNSINFEILHQYQRNGRRSNNPLLSDYIEHALIKIKGNETNETISKKRRKKLRRRAMEFTNSGIPLLIDSNDKNSSSLSINERNHLLDIELGQNKSSCISATVNSLVDLDNNGSSMERGEMVGKGKETQSSFNDSILQNTDLSLLEILQSL